MDTIIGIDLGTSTTEAAVILEGKPVMLLNFDHEVITPSVVGIDEAGNYVVGSRAKAQYLLEPEKTVIEVKRRMGSGEPIPLGKGKNTPVELSGMILNYVRCYASDYLGEEITRAVISVPAYFDDLQRQATVEAGKKAGLIVERIINEPTAAALSYGMEHMEEESHILVYDLGGGTFDVTLLELFGGVVEVKASSGDNKLGGKDFDELLMNWLADRFYDKHGKRLQDDVYAMVKLKEQAERCKVLLSSQEFCDISLPFLSEKDGEPLALNETVTVEIFEDLIRNLVERTHLPIEVVLADSGIDKPDIDMILLVGGSTRVPLVKRDVEEYMGMAASAAVNPDYAVAEGAAIQAGIISGAVSQENSIIMTDVNPFTLGVQVLEGFNDDCMSVIIPRNVTIPVTKREIYVTSSDYQTEASVNVYQGESHIASRNHFLGKFTVGGIPKRLQGEEEIAIEFSYNQNGMLVVTAFSVSTQEKASIEINMMEQAEEPKARIDVSGWKQGPAAKRFRTVIRRAEKALLNPAFWLFDPEGKEDLDELVYALKKGILENDGLISLEELEFSILDALEDCED